MIAVETNGLRKTYGGLDAIADLSLSIPEGAVYGLIGPNGAGKSTTFAILASLLRPTAGSALVMGIDPSRDPSAVRRCVGYMPDVLGVYENLRVDEYLRFFAACYAVPRRDWEDLIGNLLELVELDVKRTAMVDSLSRGMKQRLSLARALVHDPDVLILDEPASGLDPRARVELRSLLAGLAELGKTLIVSSHILSELEELCTEVGILEAGRLLASGSPRSILDRLGQGRTIEVRLSDGSTQTHQVTGDDDQKRLLRRLVVDEGLPVVEFTEVGHGLEELFMNITEGVVQ